MTVSNVEVITASETASANDAPVNNFARLKSINLNDKTEKKGAKSGNPKSGFTYLSWSYAVEELMMADSDANWTIHEPKLYPVVNPQGVTVGNQVMVSCTVTAFGKPIYMWLPVMNHANAPITNPNVTDINKAQMRCLVKAIACHGLGLYIYAGEDYPDDNEPTAPAMRDVNPQPLQPQVGFNNGYGYQGQAMPDQSAPVPQNPNAPKALTDERLYGAIDSIRKGDYTLERLFRDFVLTPQQQQTINATFPPQQMGY